MNEHYLAVLADLEQMKADAESGIRAIKRLLAKTGTVAPLPIKPRGDTDGHSIPMLITEFLNREPSKAFDAKAIGEGIGVDASNLRGTLSRLAHEKKIGRQKRGQYRAPRKPTAETAA